LLIDEEVIPVLRLEDLGERSRGMSSLAFTSSESTNSSQGFRFVSIARGRVRIYLSEHTGDGTPNTLIHLNVHDIDSIAAVLGAAVDENGLAGRECDVEDPDGNRLRIATPRT
jgi:hypothetical protein